MKYTITTNKPLEQCSYDPTEVTDTLQMGHVIAMHGDDGFLVANVRSIEEVNDKKFVLTIVADENDGDYVTEINIVGEDVIERLRPLFKLISQEKGHTWDTFERSDHPSYPDQMYSEYHDMEMARDYFPRGDYGVHTIISATAVPFQEPDNLMGEVNESEL